MLVNVQHATIEDNLLSNNAYGIVAMKSVDVTISSNAVSGHTFDGITIDQMDNVIVENNSIRTNENGIALNFANWNTLTGNVITNNRVNGLFSLNSNQNVLSLTL